MNKENYNDELVKETNERTECKLFSRRKSRRKAFLWQRIRSCVCAPMHWRSKNIQGQVKMACSPAVLGLFHRHYAILQNWRTLISRAHSTTLKNRLAVSGWRWCRLSWLLLYISCCHRHRDSSSAGERVLRLAGRKRVKR